MLTSPGVGHVAPVAELAARLAAHHGFTSTIVTYTNLSSPTNSSVLASLPPGVSTTALPEVPIDDLPADAHIVTRILIVVQRTLPHLRALLRSLLDTPAGVTVFLTDLLCPAALAVAQDLGVPRYVFYPSSVMSLSMLLHAPELARTTTCEFRDLPDPVIIPGCLPLHGADLIEPLQDRANPVYDLLVDLCLDYLRGDGFIVHTLDSMEHETLEALKDLSDKGVYPLAYAVGPFLHSYSDKSAEHHSMRWLDTFTCHYLNE
jgi:hydroquinone glucosyltransferase